MPTVRDAGASVLENRRTRILSPDKQTRLLAACTGQLRTAFLLALITGARSRET